MRTFRCDVMLGRLARRLRMLGFQTSYDPLAQDDALLRQCAEEKSTLVTRDVQLARRAGDYAERVLLTRNDLQGQLVELFKKLKTRRPKTFKTAWCTQCGGRLSRVAKKSVKGEVWPRVFSRQKAFYRCKACGKLYWKGTHVRNLAENRMAKRQRVNETRGRPLRSKQLWQD